MTDLIGTIKGPPGTPYEGGRFKVEIPVRYPFVPSEVKFITTVWHCNVESGCDIWFPDSGYICLDVLRSSHISFSRQGFPEI